VSAAAHAGVKAGGKLQDIGLTGLGILEEACSSWTNTAIMKSIFSIRRK